MSSSRKKKKMKVVNETDMKKPDGRHKNKNKFCKGCKLAKDCWKGKMAAIALCEDYV